jgi:predicted dehydrogenase
MNASGYRSGRPMLTRREFLAQAGLLGGIVILPSRVLGRAGQTPPSEKLNLACVGVGGMGFNDLKNWSDENVVALCDVDDRRAAEAFKLYPNVPRFKDYRVMLDRMAKSIDAVTVSTPDHMHAPIALAAMQLGKHVYVQKPMAQTIAGVRRLTEAARRYKVVTQMGIQMHGSEGIRLVREWVQAGLIGEVREVVCWTNRPTWPQGMEALPPAEPVPPELDWKLWLGGAADYAYNKAYLPGIWRGWYAFGAGALGDMGTHIFDYVSFALDLGVPSAITAEAADRSPVAFPRSSTVVYEFPARGPLPPVKLTWYDGNLPPPRPREWEQDLPMNGVMIGCILYGDKGPIWINDEYSPRLLPLQRMKDLKDTMPPKTLPRMPGGHYQNFARACKGEEKTEAPFDYAGPLTEIVLAGAIAQRFPGQRLVYDPRRMKFTGNADATALIHSPLPRGP